MVFEVGYRGRTIHGDRIFEVKTSYHWTVTIQFLDHGKEEVSMTPEELEKLAGRPGARCKKCGSEVP